ncbi:MAG: LysM peptidoglycan-binding domain-containing protein [Verrucomicrobiota bacterium]|jgi:LysM repeat protein
MKRISFLLVILAIWSMPAARAQDAAMQERLDKLNGRIDDLIERQEALAKRVEALHHEIESVRELASKPPGNWATPEDLKRVAKGVEEVDRKRRDDSELVQKQLERLRKVLETPLPQAKPKPAPAVKDNPVPDKPARPQQGVEHLVKPGETLSAIVQACREQKIKVTQKQILDANPGLKPDLLIPGKKIFIPAMPQP